MTPQEQKRICRILLRLISKKSVGLKSWFNKSAQYPNSISDTYKELGNKIIDILSEGK